MADSAALLNIYKYTIVGVSCLLAILFLSQLLFNINHFAIFLRSLIGLPLSAVLGIMEFREIPDLMSYAPFYFSYLGRGLLLLLLTSLLNYNSGWRIMLGVLLVPLSAVHIFLHFSPDAPTPANFKTTNISLSADDEDVV